MHFRDLRRDAPPLRPVHRWPYIDGDPQRHDRGRPMNRTEAIEALRRLKDATPREAKLSEAVAILEEVLIAHGLADVVEAFRELEVEWA